MECEAANRIATCRSEIVRQGTEARPWWLWPNLLSLDAPLVALVWLALLNRTLEAGVSWRLQVGLALAVWVIYIADRLLDTARMPSSAPASARHCFHRDHRRLFFALLIAATITGLAVAGPVALSLLNFHSLLLLPGLGLYFLMVHRLKGRTTGGWAVKEGSCGFLFAWGTALAAAGVGSPPRWLILTLLFGSLCAMNCIAISCWERPMDSHHDSWSVAVRNPAMTERLPWLVGGVALAALSLMSWEWAREFALAVLLAAVALFLTHRYRNVLPAELPRVLADVTLLTPLLFLLP